MFDFNNKIYMSSGFEMLLSSPNSNCTKCKKKIQGDKIQGDKIKCMFVIPKLSILLYNNAISYHAFCKRFK